MKRSGLTLFILCFATLPIFGQQEQSAAVAAPPVATSLPDLTPDASGRLSQEQMQQLFRAVADKDMENDKRLRNYTYIERDEEHKLDAHGDVKSTEVNSYEVMEIYGKQVKRQIEKDGKPLSEKDAAGGRRKDPESH